MTKEEAAKEARRLVRETQALWDALYGAEDRKHPDNREARRHILLAGDKLLVAAHYLEGNR